MRRRSLQRLLTIAMFAVGLSAAAVGQNTPVIEMTNTLSFAPDTVAISPGTEVEWRNTSVITHTVTADSSEATVDGSVRLPEGATPFNSGNLDPGDTFRHTFDVPGTYRYFCIPHEGARMVGTIVVRE